MQIETLKKQKNTLKISVLTLRILQKLVSLED